MKILIDTDPGIDDAVAILFALAHPGLEVLGLTTVAGNVGIEVTTGNALKLLALMGAELPVVSGARAPLTRRGVTEPRVHGADGLGGVVLPLARATARDGAPAFLAETLMAHPPGSITLCALAPLTNVAILIRDFPAAAGRLAGILAMGGAVNEPGNIGDGAEFNLSNDPEAAEIVFASDVPLTLIPLDVTRQVRADGLWLDRLPETRQGSAVRSLVEAYFDRTTDSGRPTSRPLHDPCVPLMALRPDLFGIDTFSIAIDKSDTPRAGVLSDGPIEVDIAMRVDGPAALALLAEGLG